MNGENRLNKDKEQVWVRLYEENASVTDKYLQAIGVAYESMGHEVRYIRNLNEIYATKKEIVVVATAPDALLFLRKGFHHIVYWAQGVWPEENYLRHHSRTRFAICSAIEKAALRGAERVFLVSNAMLRHYEKKYSLNIAHKSMVMACSNETLHHESFMVEGKYDKPVFTYAGSLVEYQCVDQTLETFAAVKERLPQAELLLFTGELNEAKQKVARLGISGVTIDCRPQQELWRHISRAKYGFVLREDCAINRVATPTKISTYLANGVIPVYSRCLEAFSETSAGIPRIAFDPVTFVDDLAKFEKAQLVPAEIELQYATYFMKYLDLSSRKRDVQSFLGL